MLEKGTESKTSKNCEFCPLSLCDRRLFNQCHKKTFAKGVPRGAAQEVGDPGERPPRLLVGQQVLICRQALI